MEGHRNIVELIQDFEVCGSDWRNFQFIILIADSIGTLLDDVIIVPHLDSKDIKDPDCQ